VKALSGKAFCRLLERHGWQQLRIQGSHHVYGKTGQRARISVLVPATGRSSSGCSDTS
jgi:predicted RNA binding protein YcfA (HicA-like mRNA interferase family)